MDGENSDELTIKFQQTQEDKFCPECGANMVKVDHRNEGGTLFVWYECSREDCDGQWLQKISDKTHKR